MIKRGFTLIELLACLALAGLLLAVLLQLTASVVRSERRVASVVQAATPDWQRAVQRRMQRDLDEALWVYIRRGALEIEGWCGLDAEGSAHQSPVRVVYRVVENREGLDPDVTASGLVREQTSLTEAVIRPVDQSLVAMNVAAWRRVDQRTLALSFNGTDRGEIYLRLPAVTEGEATP